MKPMPSHFRSAMLIAAPFLLAGCNAVSAVSTPPPPPSVIALANGINSEAGTFLTALAAKHAPECGFQANLAAYDHLRDLTGQLKAQIAATGGSAPVAQAGSAVARVIEGVRTSHERASARTDDSMGLCMSPAAIIIHAKAIKRATQTFNEFAAANGGQ
jgi:hypothetical protein